MTKWKVLTIAVALFVLIALVIGCDRDGGDPVGVQSVSETRFRSIIVDHDVDVDGDMDVDGTTNLDAIDIDGALQLDSTLTVGVAGTGYDVQFFSGTSGDHFLWDASEEGLVIIGTAAQNALDVQDGNVQVDDDVNVDGSTSMEALTVGVAGTGADVQFFSDTSGDHLLWDASDEALEITGTNAQTALLVDDGNVAITDDLDVDGTTNLDVTDIDGAVNMAEDLTLAASSGNQGAKTELIGIPKIQFVVGSAGTDGSVTIDVIDTSPMGECAEVDAGTNVAITADTDIFRATTNSVKLAVTTNVENDGIDCTIAQTDFSGFESVGFWIYSSETITSGDLDLTLDDTNGTDQVYDIGAVTAAIWTYKELDISGCDGNCDTTDGIHILETAQAAAYSSFAPSIYIDLMYVWDADDEEALGVAVVQDGVLDVIVMVTGTGSNRIPLPAVEYTSWVTHYESGNDFIVYLDDQSANSVLVLVATE